MEVLEAIRTRRSIRSYKKEEVKDEDLNRLLEAGRWAPSAGNVQPWEFIVVKRGEAKAKLAQAALNQRFIAEAPVVIVVCADLQRASWAYGERGETLYCLQDTAAAVQNMLLAAHALGLGTCWVGAFHEEAVRRSLDIPPRVRPVALLPIGKPAGRPPSMSKRPLGEILHFERF
ncbi:nitroreductase family protein [Candidatus Hecatella orcuttiae]|jgi:nitroreductase|uniref:nitroreductase family protein n=1 Tax=Candidatus Hecatella orcuttiae TaxID=1935119 RepID=UPI002867DA89|nr:nitroreductase family protein [Candidatus Hecatella orcuttiae]